MLPRESGRPRLKLGKSGCALNLETLMTIKTLYWYSFRQMYFHVFIVFIYYSYAIFIKDIYFFKSLGFYFLKEKLSLFILLQFFNGNTRNLFIERK